VAAIAEGRVFGVLAVAEPDLLGFGEIELLRAETAAFVAAIAHGLMTAQTAGAPPVIAGREFNSNGLFFVNFGKIFHRSEFGRSVRKVKVGERMMWCLLPSTGEGLINIEDLLV
jgi:hypothetical protein